jgi:very-short-patch-repair endonuclease
MSDDKAALFAAYWSMLAHENAPALLPEYRFVNSRKFRFDFAIVTEHTRIGIEVDGGQFAHRGGRHATDADREKLNFAAELGWRVFRYSPQQLTADPQGCIDQVCRALGLLRESAA